MFAATATFVLSLAIVLGTYWAFILLPETTAARKLRRRLGAEVAETPRGAALTRKSAPLSALKGLDRLLRWAGRLTEPLRLTVEQSGLSITTGFVVLASAFGLLVASFGVLMLTSMAWLAVVTGITAGALPYFVVRQMANRRRRLFEDQFPQAIDLIASALRAGHAFTTGVSMVGDEVPDPMGAEFRLLFDQQNYGMPLPDALKAFAIRVPLLDARFFITAVLTQREAGGNLAEILDNLAGLIRERSRVKRQVRVASAHGRITGWILSLMPPALAAVMFMIAPAHMASFLEDPLGIRLIIVALILQVIGTLAIRRIVDVEF